MARGGVAGGCIFISCFFFPLSSFFFFFIFSIFSFGEVVASDDGSPQHRRPMIMSENQRRRRPGEARRRGGENWPFVVSTYLGGTLYTQYSETPEMGMGCEKVSDSNLSTSRGDEIGQYETTKLRTYSAVPRVSQVGHLGLKVVCAVCVLCDGPLQGGSRIASLARRGGMIR